MSTLEQAPDRVANIVRVPRGNNACVSESVDQICGTMERCTLTTVARAARVSVSTVSYALRNHPKIPRDTTLRIQHLARNLGYKIHPSVAALMSHIRSARQPRNTEKIAFVWVEAAPKQASIPFNRQSIAGARARAQQLGYAMEEFWLNEPGMTSRRLSEILQARGIAGIVFSGCDRRTTVELEMDWAAHATAIIGNAPWNPELHRAAHYHFMGMRRVLHELMRRDYLRPAALLETAVNERSSRAWEAAFLAFHPTPAQARTLVQKFDPFDAEAVRRWVRHTKPDAIIITTPIFIPPLRAIVANLGEQMGCVVLNLVESNDRFAGIDPGHDLIAGNAVDLVIGQLYRNERGVPKEPMKLLFEGHWVEGQSLRPRRIDRLVDVTR